MGSGEDRQAPPFTAVTTQLEDFFAWQAGAQFGYAGSSSAAATLMAMTLAHSGILKLATPNHLARWG